MSAFFDTIASIWQNSGFNGIAADPRYLVMIVVACALLYLAIVKEFEPLLLLPIAFGMLLSNLPMGIHYACVSGLIYNNILASTEKCHVFHATHEHN